MSNMVLSSEIPVLDDMREHTRVMFEWIATWVSWYSPEGMCGMCGKVMLKQATEVFDSYLDYHVWGEHNWTDVMKWLHDRQEEVRNAFLLLNKDY